jgi:hypothetical protein
VTEDRLAEADSQLVVVEGRPCLVEDLMACAFGHTARSGRVARRFDLLLVAVSHRPPYAELLPPSSLLSTPCEFL